MPYITEKPGVLLPEDKNRRIINPKVKREEIKRLFATGNYGIKELARMFGYKSHRSVQFIVYPERKQKNLEDRADRGGWKQYYDKQYHAEKMRESRAYKYKELKGEINDK